jgi:small subunit ribosomal protein S20
MGDLRHRADADQSDANLVRHASHLLACGVVYPRPWGAASAALTSPSLAVTLFRLSVNHRFGEERDPMPHHKSAAKRLKTSAKEREHNRAVRSRVRRVVKAAAESEPGNAGENLRSAYSTLDVAVTKGVIPKARAARLKSRLARRTARRPAS